MDATTCPDNATISRNEQQSTDGRQGWTASPNDRGTVDIIWNCALTMFLCCWSVLIINVPKPGSSSWHILLRKLFLVGLCAIAPELIFQVALGQWLSARRSVKLFHGSGYTDWTLRHGFYADMGGLHLHSPNWKSFPIDAKQLHHLVIRGHVPYPELSDMHIRDKNKVDGMLRLITLIQSLWFIVNIIFRASQHLAITALELSTSAFVMFSTAISLCWMLKPADVQTPDYVRIETEVAAILQDGGEEAAGVYYYTPLDFISRQEWSWSILWSHGLNYLRKIHLAAPPAERPITRFQNTIVPAIEGPAYGLFIAVSLGYFGIFIAGWNFNFPTRMESILWRAASLTAVLSALSVCIIIQISYAWYPALRRKLRSAASQGGVLSAPLETNTTPSDRQRKRNALSTLAAYLKNNSVLKDPALNTTVEVVIATWFFGIFYCASRLYIFIADFMELRSLPRSAYQEVDWSSYWPHF
jgi:hypothetical protein